MVVASGSANQQIIPFVKRGIHDRTGVFTAWENHQVFTVLTHPLTQTTPRPFTIPPVEEMRTVVPIHERVDARGKAVVLLLALTTS